MRGRQLILPYGALVKSPWVAYWLVFHLVIYNTVFPSFLLSSSLPPPPLPPFLPSIHLGWMQEHS